MKLKLFVSITLSGLFSFALAQPPADQEPPEMGFFITSVNMGDGANLGGLEGADAHCQALAEAVGSTRTWAAYLSAAPTEDSPAVHARDRIGTGPWANANGHVMATNLDTLHYDNSALTREYSLNERGERIQSRAYGDELGQHDILTGTAMDGTLMVGEGDTTCNNWTSNDEGTAQLGHHDRSRFDVLGSSWNSVHLSRGCSQEALDATAGDGLFYCFATD